MMRALYSSVSGLKTHQTKMDVIGNNIANVNTVGFKSSRTTFSTMMYQTTSFASGASVATGKGGVNAKQIGLGATFASTAIDIDTGGASESTGKAFDLKLSDTNSTSFYIVNNGTENVFTRAGAFYVDGAGNLCMESTGYTVMGWQVDANGNIVKDTVTPLRIMSAANQTSQPEYTTDARCTGILDDNNTNVNSDRGYTMNLNFFDNLGYSYNARFAVQKTGGDGEYTVNLTDVLDSNGKSILSGTDVELNQLFGSGTAQGSNVDITDNYTIESGMGNVLDRLATTTGADNRLTYRFTSETINEYLGSERNQLPSGLTVEYIVEIDPTTGDLVNPQPDIADRFIIRNSAGARVTDTYTQQFPGWITDNNINKVVTAGTMTQDWYNRNLLAKDSNDASISLLKPSQLEALEAAFRATGGTANALTQNLAYFQEMQIQVTVQRGVVTGFTATAGQTYEQEATAVAAYLTAGITAGSANPPAADDLATAAKKTENLLTYLPQGYLQVSASQANAEGVFTTDLPNDVEIRYKQGDGSFTIVTPSSDGFKMQFSTADGSLTYIGQEGSTTQTLRMSMYELEGDNPNPFSDIQIDFSTLKNLANGATNTAAMSPGDADAEGKGKRVGVMTGLQVDNSGKIYGSYSNGNTVLLGQIAVARFANASGLESIGDNCYRTTMNSGEFDGIGVEMDSDGSSIDSGTLEMSNVDLATEFTQMITTQRGYQANSRVISTSDGILEELVNLKR